MMGLMERVKQQTPSGMTKAAILLRGQFIKHVLDCALCRQLNSWCCFKQPTATLLEVREEAIRWERECLPSGTRSVSQFVPLVVGIQYWVSEWPEINEIRELLKSQQEQLCQLT